MVSINGINEVSHPIVIFLPIILMLISAFALGRMASWLRKAESSPLRDFLYGSIGINFVFIAGFIFFGVLTHEAKIYFSGFSYTLVVLTVLGIYFLMRDVVANIGKLRSQITTSPTILKLFGLALIASNIVFVGIAVYYHSIFSEYDSLYLFLPTSKSILLDNGLDRDFFLGSDMALRTPPFTPAFNAWLIYSFGYSSLRLFPVYFILTAAIFVYSISRTITKDSFLGLISASLFLITPALLVISSRFSLQGDLAFVFAICSLFYFLLNLVGNDKIKTGTMLLLMVSTSLLPLIREVGLMISIAMLFTIPALKFTQGRKVIKLILIILSILPLYLLTLYDLLKEGAVPTIILRFILLLGATLVLYYVSVIVRNQQPLSILKPYVKYLPLLIVPLIFIAGNLFMFKGPYAVFALSSDFDKSLSLYRQIFGISTDLELDLQTAILTTWPRLDILFTSLALGSVLVFFKVRGFISLIAGLRVNPNYAVILSLLVLFLLIWAYLLNSGFQNASVRHVGYFLPILVIIITLAMKRTSSGYKLFYFGIVVFLLFYFVNYHLYTWIYSDTFGGFWIEPQKESFITLQDFVIGFILFIPLAIYEIRRKDLILFDKINIRNLIVLGLAGLIVVHSLFLNSFKFPISSIEKRDQVPPGGWEAGVFEVVSYFKTADAGNVLGVRAPAIPFFDNRTNIDLYSPQAFHSNRDLLQNLNITTLKAAIFDRGIRYIVLPNENSPHFAATQSLNEKTDLVKLVSTDASFEKIEFKQFDVYKYDPSIGLNLIGGNYVWTSANDAIVSKAGSNLKIVVKTVKDGQVYNRGVTHALLNLGESDKPLLLSMDYASQSRFGKASYVVEIRDSNDEKILWSTFLDNTSGKINRSTFKLPLELEGRQVAIRFYIVTDGPGEHALTIKKAAIKYQ